MYINPNFWRKSRQKISRQKKSRRNVEKTHQEMAKKKSKSSKLYKTKKMHKGHFDTWNFFFRVWTLLVAYLLLFPFSTKIEKILSVICCYWQLLRPLASVLEFISHLGKELILIPWSQLADTKIAKKNLTAAPTRSYYLEIVHGKPRLALNFFRKQKLSQKVTVSKFWLEIYLKKIVLSEFSKNSKFLFAKMIINTLFYVSMT